jgi:predicted tellurium resistance membrane protein TerC
MTSLELLIALLTLSTLEIVLGVDNLVFISIAVGRLPQELRPNARRFGLALACVTRIALLVVLAKMARLDDSHLRLFELWGKVISLRDVIMIGGGVFLLIKGAMEIIDAIFSDPAEPDTNATAAKFMLVILQIAIIDIVFSLDSVITAVGLADDVEVMVLAIVTSVAVMMFAARPIGEFVDAHPTIKMLALAFLVLVGVTLIAEGFDAHVPKGYVYFAMAFSVAVEMLNIRMRDRRRGRAPVKLRRQRP